jgi:thiol-disulfide isomerase/thioredoxin
MDCFTTWCGPCRYMSTKVFPEAEAGAYFNDKFISVGVQLDTIAADNAQVRGWYKDAHDLMVKYNVRAYPTFLVFAPDGHAIHRLVGSSLSAKEFIVRTQDAFDPGKQYYTQLQKFRAGARDSSFLRRLATLSLDVYDLDNGKEVAKAYFATQTDMLSPGSLNVLQGFTMASTDPGFAIFLNKAADVDKIAGAGVAEKKVADILTREYVYPVILKANAPDPNWMELQAKISEKYALQAPELIASGKVLFYENKHDWTHFQTAIIAYMKDYGEKASPEQLNDYAWTVFQNCPDMQCVGEALDWSKRSFKDQPNPAFIDTYANILYKMGHTDDAITWEQKALSLAGDGDKAGYQQTIDKMKKGEKTWN